MLLLGMSNHRDLITNLNAITWIFENEDVIRVERYIALTLMEEILRDKNNTEILVTAFDEKIHDRIARRRFSKIVDYH